MSPPRVSILIPCFNAARTVGRAVESALAQTHRNIEIIVADDGSSDDSLAVLQQYSDNQRVTIYAEPHRGGNATRNRLIELASGEFIQFLDADDELRPSKLEASLAAFACDVDMVFTDRWIVDDHGRTPEILKDPEGDLLEYFIRTSVVTMLPLCRTVTLREAGGFDATLACCQEYEFHLRLARGHWKRVQKITQPLCIYYSTPGSVSSNAARTFRTKAAILISLAQDLERDSALDERRRRAIGDQLFSCVRQLCYAGESEEAKALYAKARSLAPSAQYPAKWPLRVAVRMVGPVAAESLRKIGKRRFRKY